MARVSNIGATFRIIKQETLEATKALLVKTAKAEHAKIMADQPAPSSFVRIVDGKQGAAEEAVKATGRIVYQYSRLEEVVNFALATLRDLSPVASGDYRNAHTLYVNGVVAASLDDYRPGEDIMIANSIAYSRMIEFDKQTMRVPGTSRVYQQARRIVMNRFGNSASIEYTLRAVIDGKGVNQSKAASSGKSWWLGHDGAVRAASGVLESAIGKTHGKTAHNRSDDRWPCLVIRER